MSQDCHCDSKPQHDDAHGDHCHAPNKADWLLRITATLVAVLVALHWLSADIALWRWLAVLSHTAYEMMGTMWWGLVVAALFVGALDHVPQAWVVSVLGKGHRASGVLRATCAGLLLDLCSHGILMVGMKLYQRGASLGQVMAFLIASPWNSLSLTLILITLIGPWWTLAFIALSLLIGVVTGLVINAAIRRGMLPENPTQAEIDDDFQLWPSVKAAIAGIQWSPALVGRVLWNGVIGSKMVLRWVFLGVLLAGLMRAFISLDLFQSLFGSSFVGLLVTLGFATVIEVCSEGATPIAADIFNRAAAPGNAFAFLMAGVATDYTEIMSLKDTTGLWRMALALPLVTLPQIILIGWIMNHFATVY